MLIGAGPLVWKPSFGKQNAALPAGLRRTGMRSPSWREAVALNPRSRIVECESSDGEVVLIAVVPEELDHVIKALESA
ncbi:AbrB/MazE/SpoVT family DNA-binding domain-containing protein [Streptomyces collinus]